MHGANTTLLNSSQYYETRPVIEFKQSLWQNAFGRQTRAIIDATDARNLSSSFSASYNSKKILADAEAVYWKLSLMREMVKIKQDNLSRATKIKDWSERRARLNLAEKVDFLQADANFKMAQLELQASIDDEKDLVRQFNTMRGINSDELTEELETLTVDSVVAMNAPERKGLRDDVASFREMARSASANAALSKDKNKPTLELFSTLSLNGKDPAFNPSFKESWGGNYPYTVVGLKFSAPLDFGNIKRVNSGYELDKLSAEDSYSRKRFEVDREWNSLAKKIQELKERLKIAKQLEAAQLIKYTNEQSRHSLGRTTTYQVIMFEQDYATAQTLRLNLQSQVLQLLATMKTFDGKEEQVL
ncbi:MAG: TolC family protein, partial [bacterium]